jgi:hypothetical protein
LESILAMHCSWARESRGPAFTWLERAHAQRDGGMALMKSDPMLEKLHGDPRFAVLLRKMNLPE